MKFKDDTHEELYKYICNRMLTLDECHRAVAYLLSLDEILRGHIDEIFNFAEDCIRREELHASYQTGNSAKTTRLLFNLWNCTTTDGGVYYDAYDIKKELPSMYYSPACIFDTALAPYYVEAMKLRYPMYFS